MLRIFCNSAASSLLEKFLSTSAKLGWVVIVNIQDVTIVCISILSPREHIHSDGSWLDKLFVSSSFELEEIPLSPNRLHRFFPMQHLLPEAPDNLLILIQWTFIS